jgi:agmatine deiminase
MQADSFDAAADGFSMPGEFERHAATWMAWPTRRALWGEHLAAVKTDYARLAVAISRYEPVMMVARAQDAADAQAQCGATVRIVTLDIDDSWARDSGPIFLRSPSGKLVASSWHFNAWGRKFEPYDEDAALGLRIAEHLSVPHVEGRVTLEGGGILSDGEGTLYATETCILNPNRNPGWSKREVEADMKRVLGVEKIVWLPGDALETGTDGHIDGILALVAPARALLEVTPDRSDPRHAILAENRRALELATDARGRRIEFADIPELPREAAPNEAYCRSYVNFYIANGAVIAPLYGHPLDETALDVLRRAFPDRTVAGVPIGLIPEGGGGFHCVTQQQPAIP